MHLSGLRLCAHVNLFRPVCDGVGDVLGYLPFSVEKSRRCDDNQYITVSHFSEHKRLHLESSKRNYYIISFTSNNKSNLHSFIHIFCTTSQFPLSRPSESMYLHATIGTKFRFSATSLVRGWQCSVCDFSCSCVLQGPIQAKYKR